MKKAFYSFAVVALITISGITIGCKKSNPVSCSDATARYTTALTAYMADQSVSNCKELKSAMQKVLNSCNSTLSESQKAEYQEAINDMSCD